MPLITIESGTGVYVRGLMVISLFAAAAGAQPSPVMSLSNGIRLSIAASFPDLQPGVPPLKPELAPASGDSFYRIFWDQNQLAVFAYEIAVTRMPDNARFNILMRPAGDEFARRFPKADGGKPVPTIPGDRSLPPVRAGERASIELFDLPPIGRVIDRIEIGANASATADSNDRLRFSNMTVYINGVRAASGAAMKAVIGKYAMFYIPGRGGYFFSTDPPAGRPFVHTGLVDGVRMRFTVDNDAYDCVASAPILLQAKQGELWVYHDPNYRPGGNLTNSSATAPAPNVFFAAAADTLNWWLPDAGGESR